MEIEEQIDAALLSVRPGMEPEGGSARLVRLDGEIAFLELSGLRPLSWSSRVTVAVEGHLPHLTVMTSLRPVARGTPTDVFLWLTGLWTQERAVATNQAARGRVESGRLPDALTMLRRAAWFRLGGAVLQYYLDELSCDRCLLELACRDREPEQPVPANESG